MGRWSGHAEGREHVQKWARRTGGIINTVTWAGREGTEQEQDEGAEVEALEEGAPEAG